jgi:hypothetical protein
MLTRPYRMRPAPWSERRRHVRRSWALSFHRIEWCWEWAAWGLENWAFLEVLEYLGRFSVLIAVIFYFAESGDRLKQKHYQAWQVINSASGKGGSGGRIDALQELNHDRVPLTGVEASSAFLQSIQLPNAQLSRCDFHASDLRSSNFAQANLTFCGLESTNFRSSNFAAARLQDADLTNADLTGSNFKDSDLTRTDLEKADLRYADFKAVNWKDVGDLKLANIYGLKNAPDGFVQFALAHGAVSVASDAAWNALEQTTPDQQ